MESIDWIGPQIEKSLEQLPGGPSREDQEDLHLREVCKKFESVFASSLIKQSLKAAMAKWDDEGQDAGASAYTDMVQSQLGKYLGEQGGLGLADSLYEQLKDLPTPSSIR